MQGSANLQASPVDVGHLLDGGPFSLLQKLVIALTALSIVFDGFDGQIIGFSIPQIAKEWGIARGAFAPAVAAGLFGMGIGSICAGFIADRFGRRWALISSVLLFGAVTCATSLAGSVVTIGFLRFFAGLGIGGALPISTTLAAEFTPFRRRTPVVTATIVCVPLGGMLAGLVATRILPTYGWRTLFSVGGAVPIFFCILLAVVLPESPRFLARRPHRWNELARLFTRMARPTMPGTQFFDRAEESADRHARFSALFNAEYARDSVGLWGAFFMCLVAVYSAFSWLPTMLVSAGLNSTISSSGLTAYNMGGVIGALICAWVITHLGSRWPLLACCAGAAASALLLRQVHFETHTILLLSGLGAHGFFVNAVQSNMYALCAYVYPTMIRARGAAFALAFGRIGAVLSAFLGAAVISMGGSSAYLLLLAVAMLLVLFALASMRHHIPASRAGST